MVLKYPFENLVIPKGLQTTFLMLFANPFISKKPAAGKGKSDATKKPDPKNAKGKAPAPKAEEVGAPSLSQEEALEKVKEILPDTLLNGLASSNWKERLAAMEELGNKVDTLEASAGDPVVQQLSVKPGWKEANVQVKLITCIFNSEGVVFGLHDNRKDCQEINRFESSDGVGGTR